MPTLGRLVREGDSGRLSTLHPPLSPLVWTSMLTETSPLEHRILDFLRVNPATHKREPITSDERQVPAIWNMASAAGKRVAALGFWATYPAEPVNGLIVSDRLFTFLYSETAPPPGVVYPRELQDWAVEGLRRAQSGGDYASIKAILPWLDRAQYRRGRGNCRPLRPSGQRAPQNPDRNRSVQRSGPALVFGARAGHAGGLYPRHRQHRSCLRTIRASAAGVGERRRLRPLQRRACEVLCAHRSTAESTRALAESTGSVLMLGSDHGFTWSEGRPAGVSSVANATAARWHTENGIYLLWGKAIVFKPGAQRSRKRSATRSDAAVAHRTAAGEGRARAATTRDPTVQRRRAVRLSTALHPDGRTGQRGIG